MRLSKKLSRDQYCQIMPFDSKQAIILFFRLFFAFGSILMLSSSVVSPLIGFDMLDFLLHHKLYRIVVALVLAYIPFHQYHNIDNIRSRLLENLHDDELAKSEIIKIKPTKNFSFFLFLMGYDLSKHEVATGFYKGEIVSFEPRNESELLGHVSVAKDLGGITHTIFIPHEWLIK